MSNLIAFSFSQPFTLLHVLMWWCHVGCNSNDHLQAFTALTRSGGCTSNRNHAISFFQCEWKYRQVAVISCLISNPEYFQNVLRFTGSFFATIFRLLHHRALKRAKSHTKTRHGHNLVTLSPPFMKMPPGPSSPRFLTQITAAMPIWEHSRK